MKKKRLKTSSGITASFGYYKRKQDGKWKIVSCGSLRMGHHPFPTGLAPYSISNAVMGSPAFDTEDDLLQYLRNV